jgi:hypothetical protein
MTDKKLLFTCSFGELRRDFYDDGTYVCVDLPSGNTSWHRWEYAESRQDIAMFPNANFENYEEKEYVYYNINANFMEKLKKVYQTYLAKLVLEEL